MCEKWKRNRKENEGSVKLKVNENIGISMLIDRSMEREFILLYCFEIAKTRVKGSIIDHIDDCAIDMQLSNCNAKGESLQYQIIHTLWSISY